MKRNLFFEKKEKIIFLLQKYIFSKQKNIFVEFQNYTKQKRHKTLLNLSSVF